MQVIWMYKNLYLFRSSPEKGLYRVSGVGKLAMIQTYAGMLDEVFMRHYLQSVISWNNQTFVSCPEVTGVLPSKGSVEGGTLLTIHGHFFDQTDQPARVLVGGNQSLQKPTVSWQLWRQLTKVFWKSRAARLHETQPFTLLLSKETPWW